VEVLCSRLRNKDQHIAEFALLHESINKCLGLWQRRDIVQVEERLITVTDRTALEELARPRGPKSLISFTRPAGDRLIDTQKPTPIPPARGVAACERPAGFSGFGRAASRFGCSRFALARPRG
jgi:hypothetical protein